MSEKTYTKEQLQVIEHEGGHAVVAAVAGSGKTETLVGRVRYLLRSHSPDRIAVVMFNRDARAAFQRRTEQTIGGRVPEIRTFNSMGNKIVNRFVQLGFLPDADIADGDHRRTRIAREAFTFIFKKLNGDDVSPSKELIDGFIAFLLLVKSDTLDADDVLQKGRYGESAAGYPEAFRLFEKERRRLKIRFFEDQLYDPVRLMLERPDTQRYVADKMDHLIVDEAQDVNGIQIACLRILAGSRAKVMLVGDEDQAIYEWRGAKPDYLIRGFEKDFGDATRYTLPHTFRFGHVLSLAASHAITRNANRNPKISISAQGTPRTQIHCIGLSLGLTGLGEHIRNVLGTGVAPDDVAVLVRTYNLSVAIELELHQLGVPYFVYGRPPLTRIPEISALVGVLQLACGRWKGLGPEEARSLFRSLLQRPALYLDKVAINEIIDHAMERPDRLSDAIRAVITPATKPFHAEQIRDRADLLEIIATNTEPNERVIDVLERYLRGTDFERAIEKQSPTVESAEAILANVAAFKLIAGRHQGSIEQFLDEIDPLIDSSKVDPPDEPHVWIGSIHRAKGAQWPVVFIPGLAARSFPRDDQTSEEIEAERRLFYVAITRATDELYLAHPNDPDFRVATENVGAVVERSPNSPVSPFVWEMDIALARHAGLAIEAGGPFETVAVDRPEVANSYLSSLQLADGWSYSRRPRSSKEESSRPAEFRELRSGARIEHEVFGPGKIDKWIDQRVIRIAFDDGDTRLLIASHARLKVTSSDR